MFFAAAAGDFPGDLASSGSLAPTARYVRQGFPVSVIPPAASCHLSGSAAACWHLLLTCGARVSMGLSCPPSGVRTPGGGRNGGQAPLILAGPATCARARAWENESGQAGPPAGQPSRRRWWSHRSAPHSERPLTIRRAADAASGRGRTG